MNRIASKQSLLLLFPATHIHGLVPFGLAGYGFPPSEVGMKGYGLPLLATASANQTAKV